MRRAAVLSAWLVAGGCASSRLPATEAGLVGRRYRIEDGFWIDRAPRGASTTAPTLADFLADPSRRVWVQPADAGGAPAFAAPLMDPGIPMDAHARGAPLPAGTVVEVVGLWKVAGPDLDRAHRFVEGILAVLDGSCTLVSVDLLEFSRDRATTAQARALFFAHARPTARRPADWIAPCDRALRGGGAR